MYRLRPDTLSANPNEGFRMNIGQENHQKLKSMLHNIKVHQIMPINLYIPVIIMYYHHFNVIRESSQKLLTIKSVKCFQHLV